MAAVALEIFARDAERHEDGVPARSADLDGRRGACLRLTWVQPEDLVGHELRQAREEGKDVDAIERRWLAAGGRPAPSARRVAGAGGARSCGRSRSSCSTSSLRCRGRSPTPSRRASTRSSPQADRRRRASSARDLARPDRRRLARPRRRAACSASRSRTSRARGSARSRRRRATGRSPAGSPPRACRTTWLGALAVEPREPADEPRREHRRHPGGRRPQLHDARRRAARALRHRRSTRSTSRSSGSTTCPPGRIFTAERVAVRNLLEAYLPPETATRRNPFREWIGARLRVDAYGWAARGDPVAAARMAWADARVSHTANGVYAAMFMAAAHAASLAESSSAGVRRRRPLGRPAAEPARRGAARRRASWRTSGSGRRSSTSSTRSYGHLPLGARDQQHGARRRRAVRLRRRLLGRDLRRSSRAGWDTDTNGAAVGSMLGAIARRRRASTSAGRRRSADASRARCRASTGSRSTSSSSGRSPSPACTRRSHDARRSSSHATRGRRGRSTCRHACRSRRGRSTCSTRRRSLPLPTTRPTGPRGATRSTRWRGGGRRADRATTAARTTAPELAWTQRCFAVALAWLWDELLYDHDGGRFTPERFCAEAEREFGGLDGIVLWQAYPVIGIDERNQFDFYRDVPGIRELVAALPRARRPRLRRLQPVGRRHAPRAGRRRAGDRAARAASSAPTACSSTR